jgi:hypothetical protein
LALIVVVALALRIVGHNWDENQHLNVDDYYVTKVAMTRVNLPPDAPLGRLLDPATSPLNPRAGGEFYVYGALPLYAARAAGALATAATGNAYYSSLNGVEQIGRGLAALFDTLTLLLIYLTARRLWGAGAGLLAAALYALAVLPIQISHFYITDPFMTTFMTATLAASVLFHQTRRLRFAALAGLCTGLALACKLSAAPVVVVPVAAALALWWQARAAGEGRRAARRLIGTGALIAGTAFLGLLLADPFAVLDAGSYLRIMTEQATIQTGDKDQWFTRKYVDTWPVLYLGSQLLLLGAGPLVGLAGLAGGGLMAARAWRGRRVAEGLLLLGALAYFASIAFAETQWVRYLLPVVPYLCLFATALARRPADWRAGGAWTVRRGLVFGVLLLSAGLGALAISATFQRPHPQVQASRWIYDHVPYRTPLGIEVTANVMPLPLPGHVAPAREYQLMRFDPLADQSSPAAAAALRAWLNSADYLIIDASQAARIAPHLPWRYPVQIRYYDLLFQGRLGFTPVYIATSYPSLFGFQIRDDAGWVDPSFIEFSHPPIWIFHKDRTLSDAEWQALFADAMVQPAIPSRHAP